MPLNYLSCTLVFLHNISVDRLTTKYEINLVSFLRHRGTISFPIVRKYRRRIVIVHNSNGMLQKFASILAVHDRLGVVAPYLIEKVKKSLPSQV